MLSTEVVPPFPLGTNRSVVLQLEKAIPHLIEGRQNLIYYANVRLIGFRRRDLDTVTAWCESQVYSNSVVASHRSYQKGPVVNYLYRWVHQYMSVRCSLRD